MPALNASAWITEAVESILSQTYDNLELIVVDDGSDDNTLEILGALSESDARMRVVSSPRTGVVGARQAAYRLASGALVANMDADDIAFPHRLEAQVKAMASGLDFCGTQFDYLFGDKRREPRKRVPLNQVDAFVQLFESNPVSNPSVVFRRSTFGPDGLPYNASFVPSADYELWSRLLRDPKIRFANLPDVHMLYRAHPSQLTKPRAFANRVAAARVRLDLIDACGLDLDDYAIRNLCAPREAVTPASSENSQRTERALDETNQVLLRYAKQIFGERS